MSDINEKMLDLMPRPQYMRKVQEVVRPSEPGVQTKMSAPSPLAPVTENAPIVER